MPPSTFVYLVCVFCVVQQMLWMKIQNFEYVEQASGMKMMHNHTILGFALALTPSSSSSLLLLSVFLDSSFVVIKRATWNRKSIFAEEVACPFEHFCGLLFFPFSIDVFKTTTWFLKKLPIIFCWIEWTLKYYRFCSQIGYTFFYPSIHIISFCSIYYVEKDCAFIDIILI